MKLCKVKIKNLNSFRDEVELDFENAPLNDVPLVAITGPTGAGKTTLLDAICVALYGKTPRLTGRDTRNPKHLISHGKNEAFAEVYFEANKKRYHATWTIKRNYSPTTQLFDSSGELITTNVSQEIETILGLNFAAFNQSVMLAQGQFAAFLKAGKDSRRTILETTAGIHIYEILRQILLDKVSEVSDVYDEIERRLDQIPEASHELIEKEEVELERCNSELKTLGIKNESVQEQKGHETDRKDNFEKLQSSENRLGELTVQQPKIDELKSELEYAERANQLRAEKQAYVTAKFDKENATASLQKAETELTDAQKQVKTNQTDLDKKEEVYSTSSTERDEKMEIYTDAKSEVARSREKFAEVNKRTPTFDDLDEQIKTTSILLSEKQAKQTSLQEQIVTAQTFLDENRLPSDRDSRRIKLTELQGLISSLVQQLEDKSDAQSQHVEKISELNEKLKKISNKREKLRSKETDLINSRKKAEAAYGTLQETRTLEEWQRLRDNAIKAQSIVQQYENAERQLSDKNKNLTKLEVSLSELDESFENIEKKVFVQFQVCKRADAEVTKLEAKKDLALFAEPVNTLRQQLEEGMPCRVCGATDHPYVDRVEHESDELLESIENALEYAEMEAQEAQDQKRDLEEEQVRLKQDKLNTTKQFNMCRKEIEDLNSGTEDFRLQWRELYEYADISSEWVDERLDEADTAIKNLKELDQVSQELATCERDHKRESDSLNDTEQKLEIVTDEIEDLKLDKSETEQDFWISIPEVFHGVSPDEAVQQFDDKIKAVDLCDQELIRNSNRLEVLNTEMKGKVDRLKGLKENYKEIKAEIKRYENEAQMILEDVREKTNGLETEDEINDAITKLENNLQAKKDQHDEAKQQLEDSRILLTEKRNAKEFREEQLQQINERFQEVSDTYYKKLEEAGFESPEAHNAAFRDHTQIQTLTEKIDAHNNEKQQLDTNIIALRMHFVETPYEPEVLKQITILAEEIVEQTQDLLGKIAVLEVNIKNLKDNLRKREDLANEEHAAMKELERWQRLRDTITAHTLRDFALEIIFNQMGHIANKQLEYLTSERYQLKIESIGDLSVIDRWNANEERPVETLSGGESFLTSLALALALSELSQGRAQINSLFLDEGFGTLDAETLDIAIAALERLHVHGRSIYIISHIQELTRRLPVKINVKKKGDGSSTIDIKG